MKKTIVFFAVLLVGSIFFMPSCNEVPKETELMVLVKLGSVYYPNVTVKLYNSEQDRIDDVVMGTAYTPPENAETVGAKFYGLAEKTYYLKVEFSDGVNSYVSNSQVFVKADQQTVHTMELTKSLTGNLKVFVRKDQPTGVYIGGATVYLYKSQADRDANNIFKEGQTGTDNPQVNAASFTYLTYQTYYIKATFSMSGEDYEGFGETAAPINATTSYHVVCTVK